MSAWHGDWANRREPVYNTAGVLAGCVAADGANWVAASLDGRQVSRWSTRRQAELEVLRVLAVTVHQHHPKAPSGPPQASDQVEELRRQNEALRAQNELLKAALGRLGPAPLAKG